MITRLHRRFVGPLTPPAPSEEFSQITIHQAAYKALTRLLSSTGHYQSGLLFGDVHDDALHIRHAAPDAYPGWRRALLSPEPQYALGWVDALLAATDPAVNVDWVGSWVTRPDTHMPSTAECEQLLWYGSERGLFDERYVLVALVDDHKHI